MLKTRIIAAALASVALCGIALAQDAEGNYRDAYYLIEELRPGQALPLLRSAAEQGHLAAQRTLGLMLIYGEDLYGKEVQNEPAEGLLWMRRAAQQGDAAARLVVRHIEMQQATSPERED